jgi:hypothetical protein
VDEGVTVTLDGSNSSDPDGDISTYLWEQTGGLSVTLSDSSAVQPTFTSPDVGPSGESLTFQLTVTDSGGLQTTDTCTVIVSWANLPPVANAGPDQAVNEGDTVTLDGSNSTDPDDSIGSYLWEQTGGPLVTLSDSSAAQPTFTAPVVGFGGAAMTFMLTVTDGFGLEATDTCIVNVINGNAPPTADAGPDQTVNEGDAVTLDGSNSTDPDDGIGSYQWIQTSGTVVTLSSAATVQPTFTSPDVGPSGESLTFQLTVTDSSGLQSTDVCIVNVSWVNAAPWVDAGPDQTVTEGDTVTLNGSNSSDPDDAIASYLWSQTGGPPVTISDVNAVQPTFVTPIVDSGGTTLTFSLTVEDSGGLQAGDQVSVIVNDNGITGFPADVITSTTFAGEPFGVREENGGAFTSLRSIDPATMPASSGKPEDMVFGLIDMEIRVATPGATTTVTIYLPAPVPEGHEWYKYTADGGWTDYSAYAVFSPTRDQVTLTLTDGDIGDDDGVANGVIVDPSGAGTAPSTSSTPVSTSAGDWGSGGCFIATAAYGSYMEPHVQILRQFRDRFLLTNSAGMGFVRLYYDYSPAMANYIAKHGWLRAVVRWSLLPLVGMSWTAMRFGFGVALVIMLLLLLTMSVSVVICFKIIRRRGHSFRRQFS